MGDVPLSAENVWNFLFPLRWWCAHVLLERGMKLLYNPHLHYMLKASDKNIRIRFKICSKLAQKTTEWYHWRRSGALLVNFKHFTLSSIVSIADIEHLMRAGIVKVSLLLSSNKFATTGKTIKYILLKSSLSFH